MCSWERSRVWAGSSMQRSLAARRQHAGWCVRRCCRETGRSWNLVQPVQGQRWNRASHAKVAWRVKGHVGAVVRSQSCGSDPYLGERAGVSIVMDWWHHAGKWREQMVSRSCCPSGHAVSPGGPTPSFRPRPDDGSTDDRSRPARPPLAIPGRSSVGASPAVSSLRPRPWLACH